MTVPRELMPLTEAPPLSNGTDELTPLKIALKRHDYKKLFNFVKDAWHVVEPETPFVENWHLHILCEVLEDVYFGRKKRVIINVPPGTLKSLLVSVFFPAWIWSMNPKWKVLTAAYGAHLTTRDNLRVRDVVQSPWFQTYFRVKMEEDQNTKTRYNTTARGWRIATSVGGVGTGEHPNLIIVDDALTAAQAESEPERTTANTWFDRTLSTRGQVIDCAIVVIGQRLHEEDLPGYLMKKDPEGWHTVILPMRYVAEKPAKGDDPGYKPDPRDPRAPGFKAPATCSEGLQKILNEYSGPTGEGALLMPQLFSEKKVRQLEVDLGPYGASGQLQQKPSPEGGGLFPSNCWKYINRDELPVRRLAARGWDAAATEAGGDWTSGVKISMELVQKKDERNRMQWVRSGRIFVEDVQHVQYAPDGVDALILSTAKADGKDVIVREEKDPGAAGVSVINARTKLLVGFDYEGVTISGSKVVRSKPYRIQVLAGNVYLVRADWNSGYTRELAMFPTAKNDDQVDGSSTAFNAVVDMEVPQEDWVVW